jgi:hypothetical protein
MSFLTKFLLPLALFALVACTDQGLVAPDVSGGIPVDQPPVGVPVDPTTPDLPTTPTPVGDMVLEFTEEGADSPHTLTVTRLVNLVPGQTKSAQITIAAAFPAQFDLLIGQKDSTAAVLEATPVFYTRNPETTSLTLADDTGLFADNDVVVPNTFDFQSPGYFTLDVPLRGVQKGRGLIQVLWTSGSGERLGLATFEYRVS